MTAWWISIAVVVALLLTWRLRRAAKVLDRILREEPEQPEVELPPRAEHRNR
jgi:hypothetical protein